MQGRCRFNPWVRKIPWRRTWSHFIHTYKGDGSPLPSFEGEPERVALSGDIDRLTTDIWDALDADNRISLFVRFIDLETGDFETRIVNKNQ